MRAIGWSKSHDIALRQQYMQNKAESTASNTDGSGSGPGTYEEDPFSVAAEGNEDIFMSPP